jgi:hypothetical protein
LLSGKTLLLTIFSFITSKLLFSCSGLKQFNPIGRAIKSANCKPVILNNPEKKSSFIRELSDVVSQQEFSVISTTVKKDILKNSYRYDNNPYHIALKFCVELNMQNANTNIGYCVSILTSP